MREIIVRPLLTRLGYAHGTVANIRTEVPLRYDRAFLGRKQPKKDPPLAGRADYICDATSYGRWAVEVKAPSQALTQDDVEQAHTYCAHPEISAAYFLLTNGREFRLYATGQLAEPYLSWAYEETEQKLMNLFNVVGYDAIRRLTEIIRPDINKPLGPGLPSEVKIIGGEVLYGDHHSDHPLFQANALKGLVGAVTGGHVKRSEDGRLLASVSVRSPLQQIAALNKLAGLGDFSFYCSDEFISRNIEGPTILQNVVSGELPPGQKAQLLPGLPLIPLPGFQFTVSTEATGYVDGATFVGVLAFDYRYHILGGFSSGNPVLDAAITATPATARVEGEGTFKVLLNLPA
ncbi:type I restriction endonuclease subunit R [Bradyrhizobium sp. F1.4.3]|uniref:type I restriction endonuclease subunit R n=1 Tax=Bradyrhizobium sp. F1.4.3 TaxID=3156356 RepID=UPI00339B62BD